MPPGVHAKDQTAFRLDPDLRARLKAASEEDDRTMTDCVSEAIADWLDRRVRITTRVTTTPAPAFLAAEDEQPQHARKNCTHRNMKLSKGVCPDCYQPVGYQ